MSKLLDLAAKFVRAAVLAGAFGLCWLWIYFYTGGGSAFWWCAGIASLAGVVLWAFLRGDASGPCYG